TRSSRPVAAHPCLEPFRDPGVLVPLSPTARGGPRVSRPVFPDAPGRPAASVAAAQEGRGVLVGTRRPAHPGAGEGSRRGPRLVLDRPPRPLRPIDRAVIGPGFAGRATPFILGTYRRPVLTLREIRRPGPADDPGDPRDGLVDLGLGGGGAEAEPDGGAHTV